MGVTPISFMLALSLALIASFVLSKPVPVSDTSMLSFSEAQKITFSFAKNQILKFLAYLSLAAILHQIV